MAHFQTQNTDDSEDFDLVALWLQKDPARWIGGAVTGLFAGAISIVVGGLLAQSAGYEFLFPVKLMATILLGPFATEYGLNFKNIIVGFALYEFLTAFAGIFYGHFVRTQSMGFLLSMGATWGVFTWIFWWNLYFQSFKSINAAGVTPGAALAVCMAYGLSLAMLKWIEPLFRK